MFIPKRKNIKSLTYSIEQLVVSHSELTYTVKMLQIAGDEQRSIISEIKQERTAYANAFGLAIGKLSAHLGYDPDSEQLADLVEGIWKESNS